MVSKTAPGLVGQINALLASPVVVTIGSQPTTANSLGCCSFDSSAQVAFRSIPQLSVTGSVYGPSSPRPISSSCALPVTLLWDNFSPDSITRGAVLFGTRVMSARYCR